MKAATTGRIAGENLKRLRVGSSETQHECAQRLAACGLPITRDWVASLESGRKPSVTVDELVLMASAYRVSLAEFFNGTGDVQLSAEAEIPLTDVRGLLQGKRAGSSVVRFDLSEAGEDDPVSDRIADRLGVDLETVMDVAQQLWGHAATKERDERLSSTRPSDPKALRTLRAGMTKRLLREVREHIQKGGE
ncbi:helix-turn-helix domain-containing protein [Nocardia sp. NPDC050713]|uniref:helix-turn-helix domain-containing protein n=1 Tax=Nocardia sp. NPDC050713 TaxID=3154511 RepID=UPI0033CCEADF